MKIMKNKIFSVSLVALASLAVVSCDDYNDQFNLDDTITDVRNVTITLSSSDYGAIASNSDNQKIAADRDAEQGGTTYADALAAVGANGYFSTLAAPEDYIPAFLASSNDYRLADVGSRFTVNVNYYKDPSGYLADFGNIGTYDFTEDDYKGVWGDAVKASYLTPATLSQIPGVLGNAVADAEDGDMVVVNYAYSENEPSVGGGSGDDEPSYTPISDVVANTGGGNYTVQGTVVATYARGFLVGDETGEILVYLNATPNYSVGDIVSVSGTTTQYSGLMQFPNSSEITLLGREEAFSYPSPETLDGAALDAYVSSPSVKYVTYTGTLSISGYYYNVTVDGASAATGSIQYPVSGVVDKSLDGKEVTVTGYLIGVSGSGYTNTMATTVVAADGSSAGYTPVGLVAYADGGNYSVRGVVAATYDRGFLMTDGSGYILVYKSDTGMAAGDEVTVSGSVSEYGGFNQFSSSAEVAKVDDGEFNLPSPRPLDAAAMEAYLTAPYIGLVTYEGVLEIDGNYKNIIIDGTSNVEGSLSYATVDESLNGQRVVVTGYAIGTSGGRFFNTMVTSVEAATAANTAMLRAAVGNISTSEPNTSALYVYNGSSWSEYTTDAAAIAVLSPAVYSQYGSDEISDDDIDAVAAAYLSQNMPYVVADGSLAAVVYNSGSMVVKEYTFSQGMWTPSLDYEVMQYIFEHKEDGWSADMSTYLNETFIGSTGGFEIKDESLDGLSYVWQLDGTYGWKASAYAGGSNHTTKSWIVSPQINLLKATAPMMQFDTAVNYWTGSVDDFCSVWIATNYTGDVTTTDWKRLNVTGWPTSSSWTFYTVNLIDLSEYVGNRVNIAFCYESTSDAAPTWEIQNLMIAEKEEFDSGAGEDGGEAAAE